MRWSLSSKEGWCNLPGLSVNKKASFLVALPEIKKQTLEAGDIAGVSEIYHFKKPFPK